MQHPAQRPSHKNHVTRTRPETTAHALHHILMQQNVKTLARLRNRTQGFIHSFISFHFISFHFISFHFISFHFISFHFISFHFISFHFISFHFISFHFISFHFISFHLFHFISFHFISFHFISFHFISFQQLHSTHARHAHARVKRESRHTRCTQERLFSSVQVTFPPLLLRLSSLRRRPA